MFDIPEGIDNVELKKTISKFLSDARKKSKPEKCILCGELKTSFCNSHSVPQLSLKNIAENGKLIQASAIMGVEIIDIEKGVNNSGTFHYICNECDRTFFKDYENEQNLLLKPTDKMLAEIAVKNLILQLNKRTLEKKLYEIVQSKYDCYDNFEEFMDLHDLDIRDYKEDVLFHKKISEDNLKDGYQILFWKILPYKVPIAMQSAIALTKDQEGNEINDIYNLSKQVRVQNMHLIILPLHENSVVLAFYHKRDKLYRNLRHQINSSSEQDTLKFFNYLIFAHTENYFVTNTIYKTIEKCEKLSLLGQEKDGIPSFGMLNVYNNYGIDYQPVKIDEIPNFLSKEWSILQDEKDI